MNNFITRWWRKRHTQYYLKEHGWHRLIDLVMLILIIGLIIAFIIIKKQITPPVDTNPVNHVEKIPATSQEALSFDNPIFISSIAAQKYFDFEVEVENPDREEMYDLELSFKSSEARLRLSQVTTESSEVTPTLRANHIVIDNLSSGQKLKIKVKVSAEPLVVKRTLSWELEGRYRQGEQEKSVTHELKNLNLVSNLKASAAAYYNSQYGDQLGSGPIPPLAGLPTNYWIFLEANNEGNKLEGLTFTARLADGVTLGNGRTLSSGFLDYDEGLRRLTWTIKDLSEEDNNYRAGFEIQLIPSAEQVGKTPILVSNISYLATDSFTGTRLSGRLPDIDTSLPEDSLNEGQGVVAP